MIFLHVPGSLKNLHSSPTVIYYVLYSNFFYTQLASAFVPQKDFYDFYYDHYDTDFFSFSLSVKF